MWFIGVEVEQETSAPPPKKILDPPLLVVFYLLSFVTRRGRNNLKQEPAPVKVQVFLE